MKKRTDLEGDDPLGGDMSEFMKNAKDWKRVKFVFTNKKKPSLSDLPSIMNETRAFAKQRGITPKKVKAAIKKSAQKNLLKSKRFKKRPEIFRNAGLN